MVGRITSGAWPTRNRSHERLSVPGDEPRKTTISTCRNLQDAILARAYIWSLGGLEALGLLGLFVGPVVLALSVALWEHWTNRARNSAFAQS